MQEIWKPHVVTATVIKRDQRYLFVEELINNKLVINQPAGHLDPGETLLEAACRETLEETAWHVELTALLGIFVMETEVPGKTFVRFCFAAEPLRHEPQRPLDVEIERTLWLNREELLAREEQWRSPLVMAAVEAYESGVSYPLDLLDHRHA